MALVWAHEKKNNSLYSRLEFFIPILLLAAFFEEALWNGLIWREHVHFFESFYFLPALIEGSALKAAVLAILICPQFTHYILDGLIWKKKYQS